MALRFLAVESANTKGVGFTNVKAFTERRFGDDAWERLVSAMDEADREELRAVISMGWYPLALYARLIRALDRMFGAGDLALIAELGRFEAERDLTTIHRVLLRLANPAFIVEKTGEYWQRFHDTGRWDIRRRSPTSFTGTLSGWGYVDEALCLELESYMVRCLELVGAKNVSMHHPRCRGRGHDDCFFEATYGEESAS